MFNSGILDVVIGLIFVYSLLSLICTAINEMIESRLKMRAVDLEKGIREMLNDENYDLVRRLYNHPLISSLFEGKYDEAKKARNLPSYIPSRNFTLAMMDLVLPAEVASTKGPSKASGATGATVPIFGDKSTSATNMSIKALRDAIGTFAADDKVKKALMPLIDAAGGDIGQARKNIEDWFDSSMDRVSGWYKRRVQWITLFVALLITVGVNADTIAISNSLAYDPAKRDALIAAAQEYAKMNTTTTVAPIVESEIGACKTDPNSPECRVAKNLNEIQKLGLPIGWNTNDPIIVPNAPEGWIIKGVGWLLTTLAISLGAPFWFDLLNKIMVIRSTVRPKEKSPEEPPVNK
jgi:hypothetical protein